MLISSIRGKLYDFKICIQNFKNQNKNVKDTCWLTRPPLMTTAVQPDRESAGTRRKASSGTWTAGHPSTPHLFEEREDAA